MWNRIGATAAIVALLGVGTGAGAQGQNPPPQGHAHVSPHGGEIVEVAEHHVEFKADSSGTIAVWLLDVHQRTMAPPDGASVTLIAGGGTQMTLPLQVDAASQRLVARFDPLKFASFRAVVSLSIAGSRRNLRFRYPHQ